MIVSLQNGPIYPNFARGSLDVLGHYQARERDDYRDDAPKDWSHPPFAQPDLPVVGVSWFDAVDYCAWRSTEEVQPVRLPTEAEWEFAARGRQTALFPWGDVMPAWIPNGGRGPLQAGGALLPCVVVISVLSRWAGGLADRLGPRRPLIAGALIAGLGYLLLAVPGPSTPYWLGVLPALLVVGIGMGICVAPVTVTAMSAAGNEHVGAASAINNMVARTGGLLAIALFGLILAQRFGIAFDRSVAALALPDEAVIALASERAKLAGAILPPGLSAEQRSLLGGAILAAFVEGYRWVMVLAGALAFASAGVAILSLGRPQAKRSSKG